jgi:hypothetical protein
MAGANCRPTLLDSHFDQSPLSRATIMAERNAALDPNAGGANAPDPTTVYLDGLRTAEGRQRIVEDIQGGGLERRRQGLETAIREGSGGDPIARMDRLRSEAAEAGFYAASNSPLTREKMTERAQDHARKTGQPFEPVRPEEPWSQPFAIDSSSEARAATRVVETVHGLDRSLGANGSGHSLDEIVDRARTADGRAGIAEDVCSGKVKGGLESTIRDAATGTLPDTMSGTEQAQARVGQVLRGIGDATVLYEADRPESRSGITDLAREKAARDGTTFEDVKPHEPWASEKAMSARGCYTAELDIGGAPNKSRTQVAELISGIDAQIARDSEQGRDTPGRTRSGGLEL